MKIEPGWDHRPLGALRAALPEVVLFADANGAFAPAEAPGLCGLDDYGLACLEQPFGPDDLAAHRALGDAMVTPVGLDESLWSTRRVPRRWPRGPAGSRVSSRAVWGGLPRRSRPPEACAEAGVACFVGGILRERASAGR